MWIVKVELFILMAFVCGWCLVYNRVFMHCYELKQRLRRELGMFEDVTKLSADTNVRYQYDSWDEFNTKALTNLSYNDPTNYAHKTVKMPGLHFSIEQAKVTKTVPPAYPNNGTGTTVRMAYMFNPKIFNSFCKNNSDLYAVIPIFSRPEAALRRTSLRGTLGHSCESYRCKIFFIIGMSKTQEINKRLKLEYETERDILMIPKLDTYRDLNNKIFAMLNWILKHCRKPKYIIRMIDDVHLNLNNLFVQLDAITSKRYLFGYISTGRKALRSPKSKWYISEREWPFVDFPDYVTGTLFVFRNGMATELRTNALKAPYCWIEDVWITGTVRLQSNIPLIQTKIQPFTGKPGTLNPEHINNYLYVHEVQVKDIYTYFIASKMYSNNTSVN